MIRPRLDARLQQDTHELAHVDAGLVLLMDNAHYPWFILVPATGHTELHELDTSLYRTVWDCVAQLSRFVVDRFSVDKINVASIGNIVAQLHIHIVGRRRDDPCWPGVVWGTEAQRAWTPEQVADIRAGLQTALGQEAGA